MNVIKSTILLLFLVIPLLAHAQGAAIGKAAGKAAGNIAKDIAIDIAEEEAKKAANQQLMRLENLKNQQMDKAIDKATNPYEGKMQACMKSYQKCGEIMQSVEVCPGMTMSEVSAQQQPNESSNSQQTMKCPDGSELDHQAMAQAQKSCEIPSNCQEVMQKYIKATMVKSVVQGVGGSYIPSIPNVPSIPSIP